MAEDKTADSLLKNLSQVLIGLKACKDLSAIAKLDSVKDKKVIKKIKSTVFKVYSKTEKLKNNFCDALNKLEGNERLDIALNGEISDDSFSLESIVNSTPNKLNIEQFIGFSNTKPNLPLNEELSPEDATERIPKKTKNSIKDVIETTDDSNIEKNNEDNLSMVINETIPEKELEEPNVTNDEEKDKNVDESKSDFVHPKSDENNRKSLESKNKNNESSGDGLSKEKESLEHRNKNDDRSGDESDDGSKNKQTLKRSQPARHKKTESDQDYQSDKLTDTKNKKSKGSKQTQFIQNKKSEDIDKNSSDLELDQEYKKSNKESKKSDSEKESNAKTKKAQKNDENKGKEDKEFNEREIENKISLGKVQEPDKDSEKKNKSDSEDDSKKEQEKKEEINKTDKEESCSDQETGQEKNESNYRSDSEKESDSNNKEEKSKSTKAKNKTDKMEIKSLRIRASKKSDSYKDKNEKNEKSDLEKESDSDNEEGKNKGRKAKNNTKTKQTRSSRNKASKKSDTDEESDQNKKEKDNKSNSEQESDDDNDNIKNRRNKRKIQNSKNETRSLRNKTLKQFKQDKDSAHEEKARNNQSDSEELDKSNKEDQNKDKQAKKEKDVLKDQTFEKCDSDQESHQYKNKKVNESDSEQESDTDNKKDKTKGNYFQTKDKKEKLNSVEDNDKEECKIKGKEDKNKTCKKGTRYLRNRTSKKTDSDQESDEDKNEKTNKTDSERESDSDKEKVKTNSKDNAKMKDIRNRRSLRNKQSSDNSDSEKDSDQDLIMKKSDKKDEKSEGRKSKKVLKGKNLNEKSNKSSPGNSDQEEKVEKKNNKNNEKTENMSIISINDDDDDDPDPLSEKETCDTDSINPLLEIDLPPKSPLKPMLKLVDINKLMAPGKIPLDVCSPSIKDETSAENKTRKSVTFDSSVIILTSSDDEENPPKVRQEPLKSDDDDCTRQISDSDPENPKRRSDRNKEKRLKQTRKMRTIEVSDDSSDDSDFEINKKSRTDKNKSKIKSKFAKLKEERSKKSEILKKKKQEEKRLRKKEIKKRSKNEKNFSESSDESDAEFSWENIDPNDPKFGHKVVIKLPKFNTEDLNEKQKVFEIQRCEMARLRKSKSSKVSKEADQPKVKKLKISLKENQNKVLHSSDSEHSSTEEIEKKTKKKQRAKPKSKKTAKDKERTSDSENGSTQESTYKNNKGESEENLDSNSDEEKKEKANKSKAIENCDSDDCSEINALKEKLVDKEAKKYSDSDKSDEENDKKAKSKENNKNVDDDSESDNDTGAKDQNKKRKKSKESDSDSDKETKKKRKADKDEDTIELSESESDDEVIAKKKQKNVGRKVKKKKIISDSEDSDGEKEKKDDSDHSAEKNSDESDNSDKSDSEDEENRKKSRKRIKRASSSDEDDEKSTRKSIRKLIDKDSLSDTTKQAEAEEKERKSRIAEKQRKYNQIFEVKSDAVADKIILDFDEKKKKELLTVSKKIVKNLKPHQVDGVKFMWDACFESIERLQKAKEKGSGCILAHCMGLGKTLQVIALSHTLLTNSKKTNVEKVMVVSPVNTVLNWKSEYHKWLPKNTEFEIYELVSCKTSSVNYERASIVKEWHENGGVLIIGYNMFRTLSNPDNKGIPKKLRNTFQEGLVDPGPDLVVCDEGHLLKNEKTNLSIAMNRIKTLRRIVLTGTPLQNNLKEYWCMVQFIKPNLLGTYKEYLNRFVNPIINGQYTDSTLSDINLMRKRSHVLHKLLDGVVQRQDYCVLAPYLPPKHEYVLFINLTDIQKKLYRHYMDNLARKGAEGSNRTSFLFVDFQELQRICTHPRVLLDKSKESKDKFLDDDNEDSEGSLKDFIDDGSESEASSTPSESSDDSNSDSDGSFKKKKKKKKQKKPAPTRLTRAQRAQKREIGGESGSDSDIEISGPKQWWQQFIDGDELENINQSGKMQLLFQVLKECDEIGDKILVFSQSLYTLNCIEYFLRRVDEASQSDETSKLGGYCGSWALGLDYFRLDGSSSCDNRATWCDSFNNPSNTRARLFLISTKAGGLGINLVAANRVIIFDVSWNPSHDIQSIYRVYRFGQTKPCYVYRFVTYGTMEMKIYERQVTKQAISKRVIDEQQIDRHYSQNDIQELYKMDLDDQERPIPLVPKDVLLGEMLQKYDKTIFKYHEHQSLLENKEEEGLNEEERKAAWEEFENEKVLRQNTTSAYTMFNANMMNLPNMGGNITNASPALIQGALFNIVKKDNPTWADTQIRGILPALVQQLQVQMSENDFSMYSRVQHEIKLIQAAYQQQEAERLQRAMYQRQIALMQQQALQNKLLGNLAVNPAILGRMFQQPQLQNMQGFANRVPSTSNQHSASGERKRGRPSTISSEGSK